MPSSYQIYRDYTEDGVIGLNGRQWLNHDDGETMEFDSFRAAVSFLSNNGIDYEADDLMHIVDVNDED